MALDWLLGLLLLSTTFVDCESKRHFDSSSPYLSYKKEKSCQIGEYGKGATVPKGEGGITLVMGVVTLIHLIPQEVLVWTLSR